MAGLKPCPSTGDDETGGDCGDECENQRNDEDSGEGLGGMSFRGICGPGEFFSAAVEEGWDGVERDSSSAAADSE
jgi:hypothetical protein